VGCIGGIPLWVRGRGRDEGRKPGRGIIFEM